MVLSSEGYLSQSFKRAMIVNYEKSMGQPKYHGGGLQCNFHWSFLWAVIAFVSEYVGSKRSRKALSMVTKRSKLPPCPIWWDDGSGKTSWIALANNQRKRPYLIFEPWLVPTYFKLTIKMRISTERNSAQIETNLKWSTPDCM